MKFTIPATIPNAVATQQEDSTPLFKRNPLEGKEAVMVCIDTSPSMEMDFGVSTRLDAAKQAVEQIVAASSRATSALGLLSFNSSANVVEPVTTNFTNVVGSVRRLLSAGGTRYQPIFESLVELRPQRAILLSDGEPQDTDTDRVEAQLRPIIELRIKIDTVGIGEADAALLKLIARLTGGIYTRCDSIQALTETFAKLETRARLQLTHNS